MKQTCFIIDENKFLWVDYIDVNNILESQQIIILPSIQMHGYLLAFYNQFLILKLIVAELGIEKLNLYHHKQIINRYLTLKQRVALEEILCII